jgi:hypothetical protein
MNKFKLILTAVPTAVLAFVASWSNAAAVYEGTYGDYYLKQNSFPSGLSEEKVYMVQNPGGGGTVGVQPLVGKIGSQDNSREVHFSSNEDIYAPSNGFASGIRATDGNLNYIEITTPGLYFEDFIFNIAFDSDLNSDADFKVTTYTSDGHVQSYDDFTSNTKWINGTNEILLLANTGFLWEKIEITSTIGILEIGGVGDLKQFEISGVTAVPIPAAAWLFGSGLVGLAGIARRKKAK